MQYVPLYYDTVSRVKIAAATWWYFTPFVCVEDARSYCLLIVVLT